MNSMYWIEINRVLSESGDLGGHVGSLFQSSALDNGCVHLKQGVHRRPFDFDHWISLNGWDYLSIISRTIIVNFLLVEAYFVCKM